MILCGRYGRKGRRMPKKILIVEDEADVRNAVAYRLKAAGYSVITANDGQEGLETARREHPDLVVLDLMLPRMNGYQVCMALKYDEKYKNIPVIIFTAWKEEDNRKLAEDVRADAFISKPFEPEELMSKIRELLKED